MLNFNCNTDCRKHAEDYFNNSTLISHKCLPPNYTHVGKNTTTPLLSASGNVRKGKLLGSGLGHDRRARQTSRSECDNQASQNMRKSRMGPSWELGAFPIYFYFILIGGTSYLN